MFAKASYILLSVATLGVMFFEAPRGKLLTRTPDRGKVEQKAHASSTSPDKPTARGAYFVFIGGYHGGK
jgi:hypothetical protein